MLRFDPSNNECNSSIGAKNMDHDDHDFNNDSSGQEETIASLRAQVASLTEDHHAKLAAERERVFQSVMTSI